MDDTDDADEGGDESGDEAEERCEVSSRLTSPDGSLEAAVEMRTYDWQSSASLFLRVGGRWFQVLSSYGVSGEGGESGRYDSVSQELRFVSSANGPLLGIEIERDEQDQDWCEGDSEQARELAVCGALDGTGVCFGRITTAWSGTSLVGRIEDLDPEELSEEDRAMCGLDSGRHAAIEAAEANVTAPAVGVSVDGSGRLVWDEDAPARLRAVTDPRRLPCMVEPRPTRFVCVD